MTSLIKTSTLLAAILGASVTASADYRVLTKYKIGGDGGYDYINIDSGARRLYVAHATRVEVLNADTGEKVGEIAPTNGVHGIAIAAEFNHGFTSNGKDNTVTMFDLKTLATLKVIPTKGKKPDAIKYDPDTKNVFVCDGGSGDLAVIDADSGELKANIPLSKGLEEVTFDGHGRAFVNNEDESVIYVVDTHALKSLTSWSVDPGEGPTGLTIDPANKRLFAACGNGNLVVLDSDSGKIVTTISIDRDPDGAAFDPSTKRAFAPCRGGTLTIVQEESPDKFSVLQTLRTKYGARTITFDEKTGRLYLPTAKFGKPDPNSSSHRPAIIPDTFIVLVVGQ